MKIELSRIYNNKPYYTIRHNDGKIAHAFGYEQIRLIVEKARADKEKIELIETKFLKEHSKLVDLLGSE